MPGIPGHPSNALRSLGADAFRASSLGDGWTHITAFRTGPGKWSQVSWDQRGGSVRKVHGHDQSAPRGQRSF